MDTVRFTAVMDADRTIRVPDGVPAEPGLMEVVLIPRRPPHTETGPGRLRDRLVQIGRQMNTAADLPTDLAENHDHYAHGAPKGIDRR
jgi:hypothetical protein